MRRIHLRSCLYFVANFKFELFITYSNSRPLNTQERENIPQIFFFFFFFKETQTCRELINKNVGEIFTTENNWESVKKNHCPCRISVV